MKRLVLILFLSDNYLIQAQSYLGEIDLPKVSTDGFYRIQVTPDFSWYFTPNFANLRITDETDRNAPYILETTKDFSFEEYVPYSILEKNQQPGCCTDLTLENDQRGSINNIFLEIKNAEVTKRATLLGSDDKMSWYALKERFFFNTISNPTNTSEIRIVDFPLSNYKFYRLKIEDSTSAPLNIISVGYYRNFLKHGVYSEIPVSGENFHEETKQKKTSIRIKLDTAQWIDRISVYASGTPFFQRHSVLYEVKHYRNKRSDEIESIFPLASIDLRNERPGMVDLTGLKAGELLLEIDNKDNPPLQIDSIILFQLNRFLVAYLEKDKVYKIRIGESTMESPVYDLPLFRNKLPATLPVLLPGNVKIYEKAEAEASDTFFTRGYMWVAILGIIIVLALFTYRMLKENPTAENP